MPKVIVYHSGYGCDSGCCGHVVEVNGEQVGDFTFGHPDNSSDEAKREFVRQVVTDEYGAEHVADIDWDNCVVSYD